MRTRSVFFILGAPRSGTTMLQMALNRHSQIVIPPETAFFTLLTRSRRGQRLHWRRIRKDLGLALEPPQRRIRPGPEAREWFLRMAEAYLRKLGRTDISHFGEKSPEHQRRVPLIRRTFPEARYVLIVRDGRDVALSLSEVPWMPGDLYLGFALWLHYFKIQVRLLRDLPGRIYVVRYEDLVIHPAERFAGVLTFLGLPYEAKVAEGAGNREGVPEFEYPYKGLALEPITDARVGRWRRQLTARQIATLERMGGDALRSLGYEPATEGRVFLPPFHRLRLYARMARWLTGRAIRQKIDEYFGTCLNPANRTLALADPQYTKYEQRGERILGAP